MRTDEFIMEKEKQKNSFFQRQGEKKIYLGEYKERVIAALNKDQIIEDETYPDIIKAIEDKDAYLMKMSRELDIKKLKPYILAAEKNNLKYQLVDGISYLGNVGLVVVSKDALMTEKEDVVIRDMDQDFIDSGLGEKFSKNRGKKICKKCYKKLEEKLPNYKDQFKKINIIDIFLGVKCPNDHK